MIQKFDFILNKETKENLNSKILSYINETTTTEAYDMTILNDYPLVLQKLKNTLNLYFKDNSVDFHLIKSWGVLNKANSKNLGIHSHGYCHFSFVFYTQKDENANIVFQNLNNLEFEFKAKEDEIIIFPGYLMHYIKGGNVKDRFSFAGDILVTSKYEYHPHFLTPIDKWIQL